MEYTNDQLREYKEYIRKRESYYSIAMQTASTLINRMGHLGNEYKTQLLREYENHLKGTTQDALQGSILNLMNEVDNNENVASVKNNYMDSYKSYFRNLQLLLNKAVLTASEYKQLPPELKPNYSKRDSMVGSYQEPQERATYSNYVRNKIAGGRRSRRNRRNKKKVTRNRR